MATKTYRVSNGRSVHRYDSSTGAWADISPSTHGLPYISTETQLYDVQTVPTDYEKVFICGDIRFNQDPNIYFHGIAYSLDGGNTWVEPTGGTYETLKHHFNNIWVVNQNTIYATNNDPNGHTVKSLDGGLTFNKVMAIPAYVQYVDSIDGPYSAPSPTHGIHFRDPSMGVIGLMNAVAYTVNGGSAWTLRPINNVLGGIQPGMVVGCHITSDTKTITIVGEDRIMQSTDYGVTWVDKHFWNTSKGLHLTWTDDQHFVAFGTDSEIWKSDNGGATWSQVVPPVANKDMNAAHFYEYEEGFYSGAEPATTDEIYFTNDGCVTNNITFLGNVDFQPGGTTWALWTGKEATNCYLLTECGGGLTFEVQSDYLTYSVGHTVQICAGILPGVNDCTCFEVEELQDCPDPVTIVLGYNDFVPFPDCAICNQVCYILTDCDDPGNTLCTGSDLSAYVGQVVSIQTAAPDDTCWIVSLAPDCDCQIVPVTVDAAFADCDTCQQTCYLLTSCENPINTILVDNDLSAFVGSVISHPSFGDGGCWEVTEAPSCIGAQTIVDPGFNEFVSCYCCQNTFFELTDCTGTYPNFVTAFEGYDPAEIADIESNFLAGGVIQFEGSSGCWTGEVAEDCTQAVLVPLNYTLFDACEDCVPTPPEEERVINIRRTKPGYNTPGCPPEYTERTNCNFADMMYYKMTVARYGIKMCCEKDELLWTIRKDILDLKALYDPDFCETAVAISSCPEEDIDYPEATPVPN